MATGVCTVGAYDAGRPGGDLFPDGGFAPLGLLLGSDAGAIATATSTYGGYEASDVLDLDVDTSWYIDSTCAISSNLFCCDAESLRLDFPTPRTVSAVVMRGNQGFYAEGYDFLTARLDFLNATGGVISSRNVVFNRPNGDWAMEFAPPVTNVRAVRLVPGWAEDSASGIAEIQLYGQ
jgi:hypothetical protein